MDVLVNCTVWGREPPRADDEFDWACDWVLMESDSVSNDTLRQDPEAQALMKRLAGLSLQDLPAIRTIYGPPYRLRIPLCEDLHGDEYQICINRFSSLPSIRCDSNPAEHCPSRFPLFQLRALLPETSANDLPSIPKYVMPLGNLEVRGVSRYEDFFLDMDECDRTPITERTDYDVMIGVDSEDMPVWLVVSQQSLSDREHTPGSWPELSLPIFRGLLRGDEKNYYDCACILNSIHDLNTDQPKEAMFDELCDLIRKTRSTRYPITIEQTQDKAREIAGSPSLSELETTETESNFRIDDLDTDTASVAQPYSKSF